MDLMNKNYVSPQVSETGLEVEQLLPPDQGGNEQIAAMIAYNEIDVLLYFREKTDNPDAMLMDAALMQECDRSNVPTATNIATAEVIITALDRGDLDWREIYNPRSSYNLRSKS